MPRFTSDEVDRYAEPFYEEGTINITAAQTVSVLLTSNVLRVRWCEGTYSSDLSDPTRIRAFMTELRRVSGTLAFSLSPAQEGVKRIV